MELKAYAKLNLALSVGPPRPPKGYHPIASWFVAIELLDTLLLKRLAEGAQSRHVIRWAEGAPKATPIDWAIEKDLAVRAHRLLQAHAGRELPVEMTLQKRVPVGGGLGGGSSDAAAMLMGLNAMFGLGLTSGELARLSMGLGSDIAFFVAEAGTMAAPALVTGFGDRIERVAPVRGVEALLIIPPFGCPTGPVYQAFDRAPTRDVDEGRVRGLIDAAARTGRIDSAGLFNDLAEPACVVEPRLREALGRIRAALGPGTPVHVTGSGSTMFCLPESHAMDAAAAAIRGVDSGLVVVRTRIVP